jgi:hypothetical protein
LRSNDKNALVRMVPGWLVSCVARRVLRRLGHTEHVGVKLMTLSQLIADGAS